VPFLPRATDPVPISSDIAEEAAMTDMPMRDVPDDVIAA
jgi:hypothetical protein